MPPIPVTTRRQSNGSAGESLTSGILGAYFEVLASNIDVNGADHIVRSLESKREDFDYCIVQSKFFENSNSVLIRSSYVGDENGNTYQNFFCFCHTIQDGRGVYYFLTAEDISKLRTVEKDGNAYYEFRLSKGNGFNYLKDINYTEIVEKINFGLKYSSDLKKQILLTKSGMGRRLLLAMRAAYKPKKYPPRYFFRIFEPMQIIGDTEVTYPVKSVFVESGGSIQPLDLRWDLGFDLESWYWGPEYDRAKTTMFSIVSHYNPHVENMEDVAKEFFSSIISKTDEGKQYNVGFEQIDRIIDSVRSRFSDDRQD